MKFGLCNLFRMGFLCGHLIGCASGLEKTSSRNIQKVGQYTEIKKFQDIPPVMMPSVKSGDNSLDLYLQQSQQKIRLHPEASQNGSLVNLDSLAPYYFVDRNPIKVGTRIIVRVETNRRKLRISENDAPQEQQNQEEQQQTESIEEVKDSLPSLEPEKNDPKKVIRSIRS